MRTGLHHAVLIWVLSVSAIATAQPTKVYRIGVLVPSPAWYETVEGLRIGLKELGLEEGKHFTLDIRDWKGDAKAADDAARHLERERADLILATSTGSTIAAKRVTTDVPVVFSVGGDPVALGFAESFARSGGRLTGVYSRASDLTAKRLELLRELVPNLRRVGTFYNPRTPVAIESSRVAREAARRMGIQLVERHGASIEDLHRAMRELKVRDVDAFLKVSDPLVDNHFQAVIDTATSNKVPTMFDLQSYAMNGALASYSVSFTELGRVAARYVQCILAGARRQEMPVEGVDKVELVVNLRTARRIGLTIPPAALARADRVIE